MVNLTCSFNFKLHKEFIVLPRECFQLFSMTDKVVHGIVEKYLNSQFEVILGGISKI